MEQRTGDKCFDETLGGGKDESSTISPSKARSKLNLLKERRARDLIGIRAEDNGG
jgi:hypothetical protein